MTTVIIGAGASGLVCAIRLKQNNKNDDVVLLERLDALGKKILATGNGRCNLSNENAEHYKEVIAFFESIGLKTRTDEEGRIYPYSNQATTVKGLLEEECSRLGIKTVKECEVKSIAKDLTVLTNKGKIKADNVVVATGGKAQSSLGSNGSGYDLLKNLGHTITPLSPALVQLTSPSKYPRQLKGQRVKGNMKILLDGEAIKEEWGEILFTDYGLSGIVCMNLSEIVSRNFESKEPKKCVAVVDLASDFSEKELKEHIEKFKNLDGVLGYKVSAILSKMAGGDKEKEAHCAKNFQLIINGTKGYNFAQITSGGAELNEFENFKSKLIKNLYACGEVLDKQFECGGYNLNFAFYSGIKVADNINRRGQNND